LNHTNPGPIIGNITSPYFGFANQIAGAQNGEGFYENRQQPASGIANQVYLMKFIMDSSSLAIFEREEICNAHSA
jgi:hypothetical protein